VQTVERYILSWVAWKLPSGAQEVVMCIGYPVDSGLGGPWNIIAGSTEALKAENAIMVDELYLDKLGISGVGSTAEISGRRATVVGLTKGIRSFTTAPYIFTSFKNALNYAPALVGEDETIFFLVKTQPGADIGAVKASLKQTMPSLDVFTNDEMRWKTQRYWVFETGAGVTTMLGAIMGLVVGVVVVAQTIYAATVDHLREFGTLKAMGASNARVYQVILTQAALSAVMGYAVAISIAKALANFTRDGNVPILLPGSAAVGALVVSVAMCMIASAVSIRKATTIDPAMVFRN
jgi:putative ABC transport system permease protein